MNITPQQAEQLLKGELPLSLMSFSMLVTMLKKRYANNPSPAVLQNCADEINAFLAKYEAIAGADCANIAKL